MGNKNQKQICVWTLNLLLSYQEKNKAKMRQQTQIPLVLELIAFSLLLYVLPDQKRPTSLRGALTKIKLDLCPKRGWGLLGLGGCLWNGMFSLSYCVVVHPVIYHIDSSISIVGPGSHLGWNRYKEPNNLNKYIFTSFFFPLFQL